MKIKIKFKGKKTDMSEYQQAKIYKLCSALSNMIYIGATKFPLHKRLNEHRYSIRRGKTKAHLLMQPHLDTLRIELIENFPCETRNDLCIREGYYVRKYRNDILNIRIPARPVSEYQKEYLEVNKERLQNNRLSYYHNHKEEAKERGRLFYQNNQEKVNQRSKEYYQENKAARKKYALARYYRLKELKELNEHESEDASIDEPPFEDQN